MTHQPPPGQQPSSFPGAPAPTSSKRSWFKKWWVWLGVVVVLIGIGNALGGGGTTQSAAPATQQTAGSRSSEPAKPAPAAKAKLTLEDGWAMDKSNQFAVQVVGYVSNNTDKPITNYVQITFDALDKQGANLGTCLANTNTVDAGGKWKFKALCSGEAKEISQVRFKEITGF